MAESKGNVYMVKMKLNGEVLTEFATRSQSALLIYNNPFYYLEQERRSELIDLDVERGIDKLELEVEKME